MAARLHQPFEQQREFFGDEYDSLRQSLLRWQTACFTVAATAFVAVVALAWLALHSRLVPYVVRVDQQGWALTAPGALVDAEPFAGEDRIIRYEIAGFIRDTRAVQADPLAQAEAIERVRARSDEAASRYLTGWYNASGQVHDPYEMAKHQRVTIAIDSILRETPGATTARFAAAQRDGVALRPGTAQISTWRVAWTEQQWNLAGDPAGQTRWEAELTVALEPPAELSGATMQNPLGFRVEEISWTEQR
jgi:type IV secretory pathway TrbF-like protein